MTHDLPLLATMCDQLNVMYAGQIIERGSTGLVVQEPRHPYTEALLNSAPRIDDRSARLPSIPGQPPRLDGAHVGCRFATRCVHAADVCGTASGLGQISGEHESACVRVLSDVGPSGEVQT